jgi:motility quorum-sensing regulator/GCU-specific mRNA interferase toxin
VLLRHSSGQIYFGQLAACNVTVPLARDTIKVYNDKMEKGTPTHDLGAIKAQFADSKTRLMSLTAVKSASDIGFNVGLMVHVIHELRAGDFVKSATQHNPLDSQIWHDNYKLHWVTHPEDDEDDINRIHLYLKFAGRKAEPVTLTSFKESFDG